MDVYIINYLAAERLGNGKYNGKNSSFFLKGFAMILGWSFLLLIIDAGG